MEKTELEKHEKIVGDFLKKEEARDASADKGEASSSPEAEKEKTKAEEVKKAEEKAQEDEKILDTPDEKLSEEQKTRKAEIVKVKEDKKPPEQKNDQDRLNKRFGELTGEIKDLKKDKDFDRDKILGLEKKLSEVKEKLNPPKENVEKDAEKGRFKKYLEEDKDKSNEEKREMSKDDLEEWLLEDNAAASEWLVERSLRRSAERRSFKENQEKKKFVDDLTDKMEQSSKRVEVRHPELNTMLRADELKKEGKSEREVHEVLYKENEKYRLMYDIMKENPKKYWVEDGPELLEKEMEKRLGKTSKKGKEFTEEELETIKKDAIKEALETENERRASLDEGNSSSRSREIPKKTNLSPEMEAKKKETIRRSGLTEEEFEESVKRRATLGV